MEAMSEDGGSVRGAARVLASRLRAAWGSAGSDPPNGGSKGAATGYQNGGYAADAESRRAPRKRAEPRSERPLADSRADSAVPPLLRNAAAWSWRLLLVAAVIYLTFKVADALRLVVIPLIAALLLSALLQPLTLLLRRAGMPALAATWCTVLATVAVLVGIGTLIANRVQADYPMLASEVRRTVHEVQNYLAGPPFRLSNTRLDQLSSRLLDYLAQHKSVVAGTVVTGGRYFIEVLTGLILTAFMTFFLRKDGRKIWSWQLSRLPT